VVQKKAIIVPLEHIINALHDGMAVLENDVSNLVYSSEDAAKIIYHLKEGDFGGKEVATRLGFLSEIPILGPIISRIALPHAEQVLLAYEVSTNAYPSPHLFLLQLLELKFHAS